MKYRTSFIKTIVSLSATLFLCVFISLAIINNKTNTENLVMENLIVEKSKHASDVLSRLLHKTQAVSVIALKDYEQDEFERIAATLIDDPSILNIIIAPDGVVTKVYPLEGNEAVLGWDFFKDGAGNQEAVRAMATAQLVLEGPFMAVQGVQIMTGRLPVYTAEPDGSETFWGFVTVTLKFPQVLAVVGLDELSFQGFEYEIWRFNPADGERQVITGSNYSGKNKSRYFEKHIAIQNADWYFRIYSTRSWYDHVDILLLIFACLSVSFLIAYIARSDARVKILKLEQHTALFKQYASALEQQNQISEENVKMAGLFRHDLRHVAQMMLQCLDTGDTGGLRELLLNIDSNVGTSWKEPHLITFTGHKLIDSTLSHYMTSTEEQHIKFNANIASMDDVKADKTELAVVLANALENAVKACNEISDDKEKAVTVSGRRHGKQYFIEIANTCAGAVEINPQSGLPVSHEEGHGLGSHSIAYFAEKYGAELEFRQDGDWFHLQLLLC